MDGGLSSRKPTGLDAGGGDAGGALDDVGGSALRLIHQLAAATSAAEAIARAAPPAAGPLLAAMARWGLAGSALALETLVRALSPISRARDLLVSALLAAGLLPLLLRKLDWRGSAGADGSSEEVWLRSSKPSAISVMEYEMFSCF